MTGQTHRSRLTEWADLVGASLPEALCEESDRNADAEAARTGSEFDGNAFDADSVVDPTKSPDRPN